MKTKGTHVFVFWSDEGFTPAGRAKASVCSEADIDDHQCFAQVFGDTVEMARERAQWLAEILNATNRAHGRAGSERTKP